MISDWINYIVGAVIATLFSGITWLVKRVLTNQEEIALLKSEIKERDERRREDREIMQEIKTDLKEVKRDILDLYKRDHDKPADQE